MKLRIEITDGWKNKSYLVVDNHKVSYMGADETPFALSNITSKAALMRFALQDAKVERIALEALTMLNTGLKWEVLK